MMPFANFDVPVSFPNLYCSTHQSCVCEVCFCTFDSFQKYALHRFRKHGVKDPLRLYIPEHVTHCTVCMKQFHDRERLLNHYRHRCQTCKLNLIMRGPSISPSQADQIEEKLRLHYRSLVSKGHRRHTAFKAVFTLPGPWLPVIIEPDKFSSHHPLGCGHNYF